MTIYRGYDITPNGEGRFEIRRDKKLIRTETFPTEDTAMDCVDKMRRESRS